MVPRGSFLSTRARLSCLPQNRLRANGATARERAVSCSRTREEEVEGRKSIWPGVCRVFSLARKVEVLPAQKLLHTRGPTRALLPDTPSSLLPLSARERAFLPFPRLLRLLSHTTASHKGVVCKQTRGRCLPWAAMPFTTRHRMRSSRLHFINVSALSRAINMIPHVKQSGTAGLRRCQDACASRQRAWRYQVQGGVTVSPLHVAFQLALQHRRICTTPPADLLNRALARIQPAEPTILGIRQHTLASLRNNYTVKSSNESRVRLADDNRYERL